MKGCSVSARVCRSGVEIQVDSMVAQRAEQGDGDLKGSVPSSRTRRVHDVRENIARESGREAGEGEGEGEGRGRTK
jgi:hypothetical protein